jgi:hypothetical protein
MVAIYNFDWQKASESSRHEGETTVSQMIPATAEQGASAIDTAMQDA